MKKKNPDPVTEMRKQERDQDIHNDMQYVLSIHTASAYGTLLQFLKRLRHHRSGALGLWVPGEDSSQTVCTLLTTWPKSLRDQVAPLFYKASEASGTIRRYQKEYAVLERDLHRGFAEVYALSRSLDPQFRGWARVGKYINVYDEHASSFIALFEKMRQTIPKQVVHSDALANYCWTGVDKLRKELAI